MSYLEDKVCLVTGGAAGIGAAVVRILLMENARAVVFLDVVEHKGLALEHELRVKFGALRAKFILCDVTDEIGLADAFKYVVEKFLRLDVVVNSAAVLTTGESYKKLIEINFTGTVTSTMKAIELMGAENGGTGGVVLNISSVMALKHNPILPAYAATKAAVLHFSHSLGSELYFSKTSVRILTVCLGPTDTAILQKLNMEENKDGAAGLTSPPVERQKVASAARGIVDVINRAESGSTWMIADDTPAIDITNAISNSFDAVGIPSP